MTKIFVAEDELNMRKGLQDNLEFEGYEVECAADGEEALEQHAVIPDPPRRRTDPAPSWSPAPALAG